MTALVAALVGAFTALVVAVIERRLVARDERRTDRRKVYAEFLAACLQALVPLRFEKEEGHRRREVLAIRHAEVMLIAPKEVRDAAEALTWWIAKDSGGNGDLGDYTTARKRFLEAARRDLGYPR